jgi:hypothetical protein
MSIWNILLDFDRTVAGGHSGGRTFTTSRPMDETNKEVFLNNVKLWLSKGHRVAIITRGIDSKIESYFQSILNLTPVMNDYDEGEISIYAPDEDTFNSTGDTTWWAEKKAEFVADLINKIGSDNSGAKSLFMDDTEENVEIMSVHFPNMVCLHAEPGEYISTYAKVNEIITKSGGRKNTRVLRRKKTRKTRRNKSFGN